MQYAREESKACCYNYFKKQGVTSKAESRILEEEERFNQPEEAICQISEEKADRCNASPGATAAG